MLAYTCRNSSKSISPDLSESAAAKFILANRDINIGFILGDSNRAIQLAVKT